MVGRGPYLDGRQCGRGAILTAFTKSSIGETSALPVSRDPEPDERAMELFSFRLFRGKLRVMFPRDSQIMFADLSIRPPNHNPLYSGKPSESFRVCNISIKRRIVKT
jgi:hypothetical protein